MAKRAVPVKRRETGNETKGDGMAKSIKFVNDAQNEFQSIFRKLCFSKAEWDVWSDFVEMTATMIANSVDQDGEEHDTRERWYMETIKKYTKEEQEIFPELVGLTFEAMEQMPDQDFLGEMFMALALGSHWHGQFFTPYSICKMMARINIDEDIVKTKVANQGWIGVGDPACGAGALLVATRNELNAIGVGTENALFVAQDIDRTAALMCYIQLSMLGCAGYVVIADTLNHPATAVGLEPVRTEFNDVWETPMFRVGVWAERRLWYKMDSLMRRVPANKQVHGDAPKVVKQTPKRTVKKQAVLDAEETGQLTLF